LSRKKKQSTNSSIAKIPIIKGIFSSIKVLFMPPNPEERLQKIIAKAGIASRRGAEQLILEGQVKVNGKIVTELGTKADIATDRITVGNKTIKPALLETTVLLLNKPKGYITTRDDPQNRPTVMDLIPVRYRNLHPVGRLDGDTSGVLLLTDDGELTQLLTHPSHNIEKIYAARVRGEVPPEKLQKLIEGVRIEINEKWVIAKAKRARVIAKTDKNSLVEVTLQEGKNRQVRRMLEAVGHPVSALRRTHFAGIETEELRSGMYRELLPAEVKQLKKRAGKK
jgi:pseudouridine synthase